MSRLPMLAAVVAAGLWAAPAHALDKVNYIIDWLPNGEETFPYIAQAEGLFAKEGLDVNIIVGRGSTDVMARMGAGVASIGSGAMGAFLAAVAENKAPIKATMTVYSEQPDAIFYVAGEPIKTMADLKGMSVATATFTSSNVLWPVVARANGLDPATVNLMKVDPSTLGGLLASGRVAAVIGWMTDLPQYDGMAHQAGKKVESMPWSQMGLDGYGLSVFATDATIKDHPDWVAKFNRAYFAGVKIALGDCARGSKDMKIVVPESDYEVDRLQCEVANPLIKNAVSDKTGIGTIDPALLKATWGWVAKSQGYKVEQLDPETAVVRQFIPSGG